MLKINKVCVHAQSGNSWISENSSNADIHLETKQKKCVMRKRFECLIRKPDYSNNIATSFWSREPIKIP